MENARLAYLLQKAIEDEISDEERMEMLNLMEDPSQEEGVKQLLFDAFQRPKPLEDVSASTRNQILEAVLKSDPGTYRSKVAFPTGVQKWAIAAVIAFISLFAVFFIISRNDQPVVVQSMAKHQNDIAPGGNRATLTLADGSEISLTDASKGTIANQYGLVITKKADGQLLYEMSHQEMEHSEGYNTITTPLGGKYEVLLQDGTRVLLNSGSSVTYPLAFKKDSRRVTLKGEAYFEVAKDQHRPFFVSTPGIRNIPGQEIQVLGTHFNISAYADDDAYVTTLLEGSVKLSVLGARDGKILKPGQQAKVDEQQVKISDGDINAALAWKNDVFYMVDQPIENVMRQLSRWYNIEVSYAAAVPKIGFWAQISRRKKLSEVLDVLEQTNGVHFKIEGRKVIVMP
ncbi:FecR domain-containing protein [Pedobacter sp. FW305-3-2-15-E-R2A2]|uniref:FecR family protein n=1 Tax=Pedobacter sp. FW305-3-2-15-E-R2A2 TaxID=3140251 RepID=UPI0031408EE0